MIKNPPANAVIKNPPANARDTGLIPGQEDPWRRAQQLTPVFLPENFMDRGTWWATVHRVAKSWTQPSSHMSTRTHTDNQPAEYSAQSSTQCLCVCAQVSHD